MSNFVQKFVDVSTSPDKLADIATNSDLAKTADAVIVGSAVSRFAPDGSNRETVGHAMQATGSALAATGIVDEITNQGEKQEWSERVASEKPPERSR